MALEGQQGIVAQHAAAIVGDADEPPPAAFDFHADLGRAGIQGVFEQLFHHRRGPLHHLARRDFIGYLIGKNANAAHYFAPSVETSLDTARKSACATSDIIEAPTPQVSDISGHIGQT